MPSILFVCTANRFRSPLAAAMLRKVLEDCPIPGKWDIDSAGTWVEPGLPALPAVITIANRYGVDLRRHRSKQVTGNVLASYDLILVMEMGHRESLENEFPSLVDHIYLLSQAVDGRDYDIFDLTDSVESIMEVGANIQDLIQTGYHHICNLALRLHRNKKN